MVKVIDVTLRDGGLANDFAFSLEEAEEIFKYLVRSGVEYIEAGYFRPYLWADENGPKVSNPLYLDKLSKYKAESKIVVMSHPWSVNPKDYIKLKDCDISLVRLPVRLDILESLEDHCEILEKLGIPYSLNIIRISEYKHSTLEIVSEKISSLNPKCVYVADSNGAITPESLDDLIIKCKSYFSDVPLGFHAHNNLTLALANSILCIERGFEFIDSSIGGLGKGGGNLASELLMLYLNSRAAASFDVNNLHEANKKFINKWIANSSDEKYLSMIYGVLDMNIDKIKAVKSKSIKMDAPVYDLIMDHQ